MKGLKVLIADDDPNVREIIRLYFEKNEMIPLTAANGREALEAVRAKQPDVVILDIMMPEMDGLEVCRILRNTTPLPIIMLSAKDEEIDRILGLEIGADDYVTKPFSPRELVARIKAIMRRSQAQAAGPAGGDPDAPDFSPETFRPFTETYHYGALAIHALRRTVTVSKESVSLRPKEFDLLLFFARHPNIVVTREQILQQVWGYDYFGNIRTVDAHVKKLRHKLAPLGADYIQTVWGVGYRFDVPDDNDKSDDNKDNNIDKDENCSKEADSQ